MKVLQINVLYGYGSTGLIVKDIGNDIVSSGNEAYFAYQRTNQDVQNGYQIGNILNWKMHALLSRLFGKQSYFSKNSTKKLIKHIEKIKPDVIHMHNLHANFLHLNLLLKYIASKNIPTLITMHDCWFFTGRCYYPITIECEKFQTGCGNCPSKKLSPKTFFFDNSKSTLSDKKKYFSSIKNLQITACSNWVKQEANKGIFKGYDIKVVNNGVDINIFTPQNKDELKQEKGLTDKFVILGMANKWLIERSKGILNKTIAKLSDNERLLIVGCNNKQLEELKQYGEKVIGVGFIKGRQELAKYYSLADVFANVTHADVYPTVNMESICCGTPVVTYDSCGSPENVPENCGIVVKEDDEESFIKAIFSIKDRDFSSCGEIGKKLFDKTNKYKEYLPLYENLLKNAKK